MLCRHFVETAVPIYSIALYVVLQYVGDTNFWVDWLVKT